LKLSPIKKNELFHFLIQHNYAETNSLIHIFKENNISNLPIDSSLKIIPLLIEGGELLLADNLLKITYQRVFQKNLINKIKQVSEIRKEYFPLSIDFIFSEILFFLENMMHDAA